jgi:hypothetical protein
LSSDSKTPIPGTVVKARFTYDCGEFGDEVVVNLNHFNAEGFARNCQLCLRQKSARSECSSSE